MDVGDWLRSLGLEQYVALFREHEIDAEVLPDLTDADLEKLGVPFGHRKRLLKAIAKLDAPAADTAEAAPPAPRLAAQLPDASAERRHLAVLFCDLVGSTAISAGLDAEDWRNLVNSYLDAASEAVTQMGGRVAKKLGDGLMALFGYPTAQENDSERAVRAALLIQRALAEVNRRHASLGRPELVARIGVESGAVVVDAAGEIFGDAPNIAARVQGLAEPGTVLATANVQRQTAGLFVAEDRGAHALKGAPRPVALYRIVRASGGRRLGARALTPLVGREEELDLLRRRWERARAGEGQLALVVGEPGIGKSRLIEEFRLGLGEAPHTFVEWSSSQLLQNTPLHPVAEWGRQRFGAELPADDRLADLEGTLELVGLDPAEYAPLLAPLVDIPLPAGRAPSLQPEELRRRQLAALATWVLAGARSQPAALAFEDLHWADPTSLDLLQTLAERGRQTPLFIIATARPEFRPPWSLRFHHSVISLSPLARAEVARMVGEMSACHALSKEVVEGLSERTGGVPLFVEEVTRLLLERGETGGLQAIPPTLQQSLAARLDRLGEAREVAQVGAVLGRSFSYALLSAVGGVADPALQSALDRLAGADLLFAEGAGQKASYRFKHALIQDAAYDSLLKSRRQPLHRRAAEFLREAGAEPETIAHHFTEARLDDLAIEWWGKAGDQALRRSAFQEAIAHLGKAIAMADKTHETGSAAATASASANQRLKLQTSLGRALMWSRGYVADETRAAFIRARELATAIDNPNERFTVYLGLWTSSLLRGELRLAREIAETFLREAERGAGATECKAGRCHVGLTCLLQGDFLEAQANLVETLSNYDPERDGKARFRFGGDAGAVGRAYLAATKWLLGEVGPARALIEEAVALATELNHIPTLVHVYFYKAHFEMVRGDAAAVRRTAEILIKLSQENELPFYSVLGTLAFAWAGARLHSREIGVTELRQSLEAFCGQGNKAKVPFYQGLLAEIEAAGDPAGALTRIDAALALASENGEHWSDTLLHRIRGEILLKRDPANSAPAEEAFLTAIAIAQQQKARSFELQAALSLAKLYQSTGRPGEAHAVLAPALEGFSPTPEVPEIAEAQALLAELAETDEVKAALTHRERRLHLQTSYGQAMMWAKGFGAETEAAFSRATKLTAKTDNFADRFTAGHGQWTLASVRGELRSARDLQLSFLKEAEDTGRIVEAGVARRGLAHACYQAADFLDARTHCERALETCDVECDRETQERFHDATGPVVMSFLAVVMWQLGEVERARQLIEQANRGASDLGHAPSMVRPLLWKVHLEVLRGDPAAALSAAEALEGLAREHGMAFWRADARLNAAWARGRLHDAAAGAEDLRRGLADRVHQGASYNPWFYNGLLAELEAETLSAALALARLEEAMALARQVEFRCNLAFPHLRRGELLLNRDPSNSAPAEGAFRTGLAVAKEQGARSWGLRAALALARLYQSTGRPAEARAVLAPALEGFAPTPEMPEIAEAMSLSAGLA